MAKRPILYFLAAFIAGIWCNEQSSMVIFWSLFLLLLVIEAISIRLHVFTTILYPQDRILLLIPFFFCLGFVWVNQYQQPYPVDEVLEDEMKGNVEGRIVSIEEGETTRKVTITSAHFTNESSTYACGKVLIYLKSKNQYTIGNQISCYGTITRFDRASNPGQFDEAKYYKIQGYHYKFFADSDQLMNPKENMISRWTEKVKEQLLHSYQCIYDEEDFGLVSAMLLGESSYMEEEVKTLYRQSGIAHILAISGLHITLLGVGFYQLLRKLKINQKIGIFLSVLFIFYYGILTGFSVSTNRAIVMLIISLCAILFGKTYDITCAMAFSAFVILLQNPMQLYSTGFLLSFSAILGIVFLGGAVKRAFGVKNSIINAIVVSIVAQITTLPFVLYYFFEFPLYAVIVNLALYPLCSILVGFALFSGIIGCVWSRAGMFLAGGVHYILEGIQMLCQFSQKFPGHNQIWGKPSRITVAGYLILLVLVLLAWYYLLYIRDGIIQDSKKKGMVEQDVKLALEQIRHEKEWQSINQKSSKEFITVQVIDRSKQSFHLNQLDRIKLPKDMRVRRLLVLSCMNKISYVILLTAICLLTICFRPNHVQGLEITMLDVGQGDCFYLETSSGRNYLIDGGSSSVKQLTKYRLLPFLKSHGENHLDYVAITHPDSDHTSGIIELIEEKYPIGCILLPNISIKDQAYLELEKKIIGANIPIRYLKRGDKLVDGFITITCLHPEAEFYTSDVNAYSMVLSLNYKEFQMLFTGDLEKEGEEAMCNYFANHPIDYDVLKVAHHGSNYSTSRQFLSLVQPEYCILSVGKKNRYGHPSNEVLERIEEIHSRYDTTMKSGAVMIWTDGNRLRTHRYKEEYNG